MSFLRRIARFATAPSAPAATAPASRTGGPLTLGQFMHSRGGYAVDPLSPRHGFTPMTEQELNNSVWPEAGADPAFDGMSDANPAGVGESLRHPVPRLSGIAGNSEQGVPGKRSSRSTLEVSRLNNVSMQSGSVEHAHGFFGIGLKGASERTSVHPEPLQHRPAKHFSEPSSGVTSATPVQAEQASDGEHGVPAQSRAMRDVGGFGPTPASVFPAQQMPAVAEARPLATFGSQTATSHTDLAGSNLSAAGSVRESGPALSAAAGNANIISVETPSPSALSDMVSDTVIAAVAPVPTPGTNSEYARESSSVIYNYSVESRPAEPPRSSPERSDATRESPFRGATSEPAPIVHIGNVEIIIEAPAEPPRATSHSTPPAGDFASRYYLRGL